jgi:hypothetical protein
MIPVKEAVARSVDFASNMLDPPPHDLRLEEVELGKVGPNDAWQITLSMQDRTLGSFGRREYKVFRVRGDTGEVVSMKIRELAHAE